MKTQPYHTSSLGPAPLSLHTIVSHVMDDYMMVAELNKNSVLNDIPGELPVTANKELLISVLNGMFHTIVSHARNSCIRVVAKTYNNVVLVHIKDSNTANGYAVASGLARFRSLAEKMGGYLDITSQRSKETTIAFSFPNLPFAA